MSKVEILALLGFIKSQALTFLKKKPAKGGQKMSKVGLKVANLFATKWGKFIATATQVAISGLKKNLQKKNDKNRKGQRSKVNL